MMVVESCPSIDDAKQMVQERSQFQVGDVVFFKKHDSSLSKTYQFGIVSKVEVSKDGVCRKVMVRYCNSKTFRSVRELVLIRSVDELDLFEQLAEKCK